MIGSCKKNVRDLKYTTYTVSVANSSAKIPEKLWDSIENVGQLPAAGAKEHKTADDGHGAGGSEATASNPKREQSLGSSRKPVEFKPIKVFLIEENRGVLGGKNHRIEFGPGGGEIDLRDFVRSDFKGAFRVAFEFEPTRNEKATSAVYYVSNAIKRKVSTDPYSTVWGAGCNKYFNISSRFDKAMRSNGYLVHTNENRHLSALAGTYVFAVSGDLSIGVAQVTIKDSRFRQLLCRT